jgi:hypothetical protein
MDIIKRIDELKKLVDSDKFDKKYEGQKKTEVLAGQHVISACEDIREFGDKIIAKVTFGYSDPKTGVSMISETVIADKETPLNTIKETALLSLIGSIESSDVAEAENSEKKENVSGNEKADTEKEPENIEKTAEKQNDVENIESSSENSEESSADNAVQTEAENTEDSVTEDSKDSSKEDAEDIITGNASEMFENKEPSAKNPLNEDFTENKAVDKTETEEKVEVAENIQDTAQNKSEKTSKEKTSKKAENTKPAKKDVDKTDTEKHSDNAEIPEYKPKTLDKIQIQEIEVLAKHLAKNKDDRNAVLKKFFERLEFHKGLKKEYADEIKNLLADESQRLANRYGEEILNLMFDKAYKLISPETEGENLLLKIDSLKILVCATALVVCEAALHEIMV